MAKGDSCKNVGKKERKKRVQTPDSVRLRMADLCSRSEQCSADVLEKILKTGISRDDAGDILDFLKREKFIDDARFARAFSRDKVRFSGWGKLKIRMHLRAKRISDSDIATALEEIDSADYIAALKRAGIAKAKTLNVFEATDAQKLIRHLASRGFESGLIMKFLSAVRKKLSDSEKDRD